MGAYATGIHYHPDGAIAGFRYGNGVMRSLTQNVRLLPATATDTGALNDVYSYDKNGNVAAIADQFGGTNGRTMAYDDLDRLTNVAAPALWGSATYSYDALDNLTGNAIAAGATARSVAFNYPDPATNRLMGVSGSAGYNVTYAYDSQGNIVQRGAQAYAFDQGNRMSAAVGVATYRYDGLGHRVSVVGSDGANRIQVYSQGGQLLQAGPAGAATRYIYLHRHVLAEAGPAGIQYQHTDALGSPVARTDGAGALVSQTRYEAYGKTAAGATPTLGFTGHVNDADTALVYMQQRYYDPVAGRFLSIDPVTTDANTGGGFNRYAYANNSPYKYIDPDGRDAMDWVHGGLTAASFCPSVCGSAFSAVDGAVSLAQGDRVGAGIAFGAAALGTISDAGAIKVAAMAAREVAGATKVAGATASVAKEAGAAGKAFSKEKQALVDMAKTDKKAGITSADMKAYKDLNAKLPDPFPTNKVRGPEAHSSGAPSSQAPHGHVGPVDHIPVKD